MRHTKKFFYTDAAVDGFHFYFQNPYYIEELLAEGRKKSDAAVKRGALSDPTAADVIYRDELLRSHAPYVAKWEAAEKAVGRLEQEPDGRAKMDILKAAYAHPDAGVSERVRKAAVLIPISEPTAMRWIAEACLHWARFRGLI